jgi:hypothetical protein
VALCPASAHLQDISPREECGQLVAAPVSLVCHSGRRRGGRCGRRCGRNGLGGCGFGRLRGGCLRGGGGKSHSSSSSESCVARVSLVCRSCASLVCVARVAACVASVSLACRSCVASVSLACRSCVARVCRSCRRSCPVYGAALITLRCPARSPAAATATTRAGLATRVGPGTIAAAMSGCATGPTTRAAARQR